jgi:hypothetical protein
MAHLEFKTLYADFSNTLLGNLVHFLNCKKGKETPYFFRGFPTNQIPMLGTEGFPSKNLQFSQKTWALSVSFLEDVLKAG